jgi:peptidoglycan hydrolase-like protein with peptidoglycan-binding domain
MKLLQTLAIAGVLAFTAAGAQAEETYKQATRMNELREAAHAAPDAPVKITPYKIMRAQKVLNSKGYAIRIDGVHSDETTAALKQYQHDNNLDVTGTLNEQTLRELDIARAVQD